METQDSPLDLRVGQEEQPPSQHELLNQQQQDTPPSAMQEVSLDLTIRPVRDTVLRFAAGHQQQEQQQREPIPVIHWILLRSLQHLEKR